MNFDNWYQTIDDKLKLETDKSYSLMHYGKTGVIKKENKRVTTGIFPPVNLIISFIDFEPLLNTDSVLKPIVYNIAYWATPQGPMDTNSLAIIGTSDYNSKHIKKLTEESQDFLEKRGNRTIITNWYYFSHAFIALDWYRQYRFYTSDDLIKNRTFDYNFITQNRLVTDARNYRLVLMSELEERGLTSRALVSYTGYKEENNKYILPANKIAKIKQYCSKSKRFDEQGDAIENQSMHINIGTHLSSFFNLVTETCFYESMNHLTEKIFRPIVMMQPFVLASTQGNLAYLKRYGFKTFDRWIDESYDTISNPFKRIDAIVRVMDNICSLSKDQQKDMYQEMLPTLLHNRHHFYNDLYNIAYNEMWDNFRNCYSKMPVSN